MNYIEGELGLWLLFRALPATIITSIVVLLFTISPARAEESGGPASESVNPNGVLAGQLLFWQAGVGEYRPALVQASKVHFDISGMIATVSLEQSFRNTSDQWAEGIYAFPLPGQAAVRHMEMIIGERRIVGKIKEKSIAKKIYQQAKQSGKKASLVEQQRPNLFTNKVANIGPGEELIVRLEYVQKIAYLNGEFSLRFPMTITPRYTPLVARQNEEIPTPEQELQINSSLGWVLPAASPANKNGLNQIEISARLDMGMPLSQVAANYHEIVLKRNKGLYEIGLAAGVSEMNRDFVLGWRPVTGSAPSAAVFTERAGGEQYGLLMLVPPELASLSKEEVLAREMIFVIDTSGSMGGESIAQARESLAMALAQLRPQDSFNIIEFNSDFRALYRTPVPATRHYIQSAGEFVRQLSANGGTEMLPALRAALVAPRPLEKVRQVIFITDGAIGNERQLFEEIQRTLGDSRLFTVAIGSAPNSWFMRKAALFGRGSHTHIADLSEVTDKMQALFERISTPLAVDIKVAWPGNVEVYPQRVPDLYRGEPVLVAFKSKEGSSPGDEIVVSGQMADTPWSRRIAIPSSKQNPGVASIWARDKIAALLDQKILGKSEQLVREAVLKVALAHSLMSPYTSFVAVEERVSRPAESGLKKAPVPNSRPKGLSPQAFAYPQTATTGPANIFLGGLFLFLTMMTYVMRRPEVDSDSIADE